MNKKLYELIEEHMCTVLGDSCHDKSHSYRVLYTALEIAKNVDEPIDYEVLAFACLLHDIARVEQAKDTSVCHAVLGKKMSIEFLLSQKYDKEKSNHIGDCIETHRFRKSKEPQSIEAKILFDADKIDAIGSIGIARALCFTGDIKAPIYEVDEDGEILEKSNSFVGEYNFKLKNLHNKLYTDSAKKLSKKRIENQQKYYETLIEEVNDILKNKDVVETLTR